MFVVKVLIIHIAFSVIDNSLLIGAWVYLWMLHGTKWPVSKTPDLIEEAAIAPDITSSGVFSKVYSFWSCPLYGHFAPL